MSLTHTLLNTVKKYNMIKSGDRVLVALSGGADSVALLRLLLEISKEYGFTLGAAHVNHQLRKTADRDMHFCEELCKNLGIPLTVKTIDIKKEAKEQSISEELCARNARYSFFESLGYDKIATAHNKNDNAETILFNFMRGAGTVGLCGIPYVRGRVIRPLLDIKKSEITEFCKENGYDFVTDETNFEEIYTRNKIRLSLIPEIERTFNSNFVNTVTANSELLSNDADFLDNFSKNLYKGEVLSSYLKDMHPAVLFRIIQTYYKERTASLQNLSVNFIKEIISLMEHGQTGTKIDLPNGFEAYLSYGKLVIDKKIEYTGFEYAITPEKPLFIPETGVTITLKRDKTGKISLPDTKGLTIRSKRRGDFFYPVGMTGKKRLSDYFTDKKIPQKQRFNIPILTKDNEVVSVIGYRNDRRFVGTYSDFYSISIKEADNAE
ncbi:MAG: tRNA lysidine(34) synthetase TilS [Firmicutes bacterium]|nr:tRNA lysidine(34) synthetase TilS [Bacillota bacterium]